MMITTEKGRVEIKLSDKAERELRKLRKKYEDDLEAHGLPRDTIITDKCHVEAHQNEK